MKIVFLNTWGDNMRPELTRYLQDQARDTDIFCLQEATEAMKRRCEPVFADYTEITDYKFLSERDHFPQSIFVKKGIQVFSSGTLMAAAMDRGLAIYVEIKHGDMPLFICNVHGKARPNDKLDDLGRLGQSQELIDFFKDRSDGVIIGGDFNILPEAVSIRTFEEHGYRDLIKEYGIATTRNRLAWDRYPTKLFYSDYVFVNDYPVVRSFEVPKNEVSDHLPLILEID